MRCRDSIVPSQSMRAAMRGSQNARISARRLCRHCPWTRGLSVGGGARRDHFRFDRRTAASNHVRLHREVLGEAEPVDPLRGVAVPLLDALPEFTIVLPRKGGAILLTLVLEDRHLLRPQLVLRQRDQHVGLGYLPLLPGAAIVPHLRRRARVLCKRRLYGFETHPMRAVGIGKIAGDEYQLRLLLFEQIENYPDVFGTDWILLSLSGLIESPVP